VIEKNGRPVKNPLVLFPEKRNFSLSAKLLSTNIAELCERDC
jgi:hypothetical protein